jgi:transcription initiation factor IIE alpha subunit
MAQAEVVKFLEKNQTTWFTPKEVSEVVGNSVGCTNDNLRRLYKQKIVIRKQFRKKKQWNIFLYKITTKKR